MVVVYDLGVGAEELSRFRSQLRKSSNLFLGTRHNLVLLFPVAELRSVLPLHRLVPVRIFETQLLLHAFESYHDLGH